VYAGRATVGVYMKEPQVRRGGSGSLCIKAGPVRKLRRQGWAGASADTEEATWTPTPGQTPLHFILALNRPSQALPETPRHCTSWLARDGLPLFHKSLPLLNVKAAGWRVLHDTM
jgi:hypothetical protein